MECFCAIISETFTTTLMTTDNCVVIPDVKLYDPMNNIIFRVIVKQNHNGTKCNL